MNIKRLLGLVLVAGAAVGTLAVARKKKAAVDKKHAEQEPKEPKKT